jgi:RNA polymerase sigma-70 factor (ECF subfamily)
MQAVMGQVALMMDGRSDVDAGSASRADRAMERHACGDEVSFIEIYDELAPRLHRFALRWTRNRSSAEDTVQQTLLQIHAARDRFVPGGAVVPWAYAIARRLLIDLGRRGSREDLRADDVLDPEEPTPAQSPEEALHWRRMGADARRDLATLPPAWREAFELVKFEGLSVAETAAVLGITRGMVKIRTYRATTALRKAMARRHRDSASSYARPDSPLRRPRDLQPGIRDTTTWHGAGHRGAGLRSGRRSGGTGARPGRRPRAAARQRTGRSRSCAGRRRPRSRA